MLRQGVNLVARHVSAAGPSCTRSLAQAALASASSSSSLWTQQSLRMLSSSTASSSCDSLLPAWVFLGPPGVGKGTYATRIAEWLSIPHVAAGDLVRDEMKSGSELGREMTDVVNSGDLLSDSVVTKLLQKRVQQAHDEGDSGVLLDGFPRTVAQARGLLGIADVQLALNLQLREDVLLEKCLGRRICSKCGKGYNVADINVPEHPTLGLPAINMPPLNPPPECEEHLLTRADDTKQVVLHRLEVYKEQAQPIEQFFRDQGLLTDFQISGGIPETLPRLKMLLEPYADRLRGSGGSSSSAAHA